MGHAADKEQGTLPEQEPGVKQVSSEKQGSRAGQASPAEQGSRVGQTSPAKQGSRVGQTSPAKQGSRAGQASPAEQGSRVGQTSPAKQGSQAGQVPMPEQDLPLRRILLIVAYDGTNYCGWQVQINGITIQQVLQAAIEDLVQEKICLTGASRTDSGVHALGQAAVFDTHRTIAAERFAYAINQRLPKDIVIQRSLEVPPDFHPRYQKVSKTYEYRILNSRMPDPTQRLYSYFVPRQLNLEAMREAAGYLVGTHDFKNFASTKTDVVDTVRTVYALDLEKKGDLLTIRVTGNGFLYNMVRMITGALLKVGYGQRQPEFLKEVLESEERIIPGPTAPAQGLTLMEIRYEDGLGLSLEGTGSR